MTQPKLAAQANHTSSVWLNKDSCSLDAFKQVVEVQTAAAAVPLADSVIHNVPVYNANKIRAALARGDTGHDYMAEWSQVLSAGAGIVCIKQAYTDLKLLDQVRDSLWSIIESERSTSEADAGDHFAPAGANDRLWNAHEKLCVASPDLFIRYNSNELIALISQAWLGPHYQMTTQVNIVHPGGKAQTCHRDYHMGFQNSAILERYPAHIHAMTPTLTLQGAIAHSDMSVESGPTKLLPYSHQYIPGYIAVQNPEFRDYFEQHYIQLPMEKGDALFFNPATFHAAGDNHSSDCHRFANLMQIGSGYARSIEIVDRARMCKVLYPHLLQGKQNGDLDLATQITVLNACAEGYPFPTNLDFDSPLGGMVPQSQWDLMHQALQESWPAERLSSEMDQQSSNKRSH